MDALKAPASRTARARQVFRESFTSETERIEYYRDMAHRRWADVSRRSRIAQGLHPVIDDPVAVERLADLLAERVVVRLRAGVS